MYSMCMVCLLGLFFFLNKGTSHQSSTHSLRYLQRPRIGSSQDWKSQLLLYPQRAGDKTVTQSLSHCQAKEPAQAEV